jgi:ABC-type molybdate transport system substrate-binding protein
VSGYLKAGQWHEGWCVLGRNFDYRFTYEHSAFAAYLANPSGYRYASLPSEIGLSDSRLNESYEHIGIDIPGLHARHSRSVVRIPASRVTWGLTIMKDAPNPAHAISFLQTVFSAEGVAIQKSVGPGPISPPVVSRADSRELPAALRGPVAIRPQEH